MELREQIKRQIRQIGQTVTVQSGGWTGMPYRAMIQNIRYKNKMYLQDTVTPLGSVSQDHYLYIGPFDHDLTGLPETTVLHTQRQDYHIIKCDRIMLGDEILYIWAVLKQYKEDAQ